MIEIFESPAFLCCVFVGIFITVRLIRRYLGKNSETLFSPITFIELMLLYYVIVAPILMIANGDTDYVGKDMSSYIPLSWYGAFVSYFSILLGYKIRLTQRRASAQRTMKENPEKIFGIGMVLTLLGIIVYLLNGGITLDQLMFSTFSEQSEIMDSSLSGYGKQMINFCIPGCCMMYVAYIKGCKSMKNKLMMIALLALSFSCFIIAGFRYRIVYFIISFITIHYIYKKAKPNLFVWGGFFILLIYVMGIIGATRNYHAGLDINELENYSDSDIITKGMNDTRIFYSTGALMDNVRKTGDYVYFKPLYTAICMPIPRSFFPDKPDADYLVDMNNRIWMTAEYGIAFMNYGEAFYAFGWLGIILNGLFIGFFSRYVMTRFRRNPQSTYNLMILALFNGLTYVILSRGYFAQLITILFLTVLIPLYIYKKMLKA